MQQTLEAIEGSSVSFHNLLEVGTLKQMLQISSSCYCLFMILVCTYRVSVMKIYFVTYTLYGYFKTIEIIKVYSNRSSTDFSFDLGYFEFGFILKPWMQFMLSLHPLE